MKALENQNLTNQSDERLQVEAARQDPARFAELYEGNFERVYAYVARRVGNREEAQDVTADVFHQALAGLPRFEWRGLPFVAWLLGIAANVLSDRWQRAATHQEAVNDDSIKLELKTISSSGPCFTNSSRRCPTISGG